MSEATAAEAGRREAEGDGDTLVRGAALTFAAKIAGGVFTLVLTIFLTRRLGPAGYGVFALAFSVISLAELPSDFGVAVALPRFLVEHRLDRRLLGELVADGIRLELLGTLLVAGTLAALAGVIASAYGTPALALPLRALAISIVGQNFLFLFSGVFQAMRRQAFTLWASTLESVAELSASVAIVLIAGGASAAAFGRAAGYAVGSLGALVLTVRLLGPEILPRRVSSQGHARQIAGYAKTLWVIDGVFTAFGQVDVLLIGAFLSATSVSFFSAPMRLITALQYPGYAIAAAVSPRLLKSDQSTPDLGAFEGAVRFLTILMMAATVVTTVWATPVIRYSLGPGYGKAGEVLRALGPLVFLSGGAALVSTALNYLGGAGRRLLVAIATLLANLVLDLILIPRIGVIGGAIGSDVGLAIYVLAQFRVCLSLLGLDAMPYVTMLLRCVIAAVPMAIVLAVCGTGPLPVPIAIAGGAAGLVAYGLALVLVGEVSRQEAQLMLRFVWRKLDSRLHRSRPES